VLPPLIAQSLWCSRSDFACSHGARALIARVPMVLARSDFSCPHGATRIARVPRVPLTRIARVPLLFGTLVAGVRRAPFLRDARAILGLIIS